MHKKGDILKLKDPGLNVRTDVQLWRDSSGKEHWVHWTETRKFYVGKMCEVQELNGDFLTVVFYLDNEEDPWATTKVTFFMPEEWFVSANQTEQKCTCDIMDLMSCGCKCGQIEREKNAGI